MASSRVAALLALLLVACGDGMDEDAGPGDVDAGPGGVDAGPGGTDAGPGGTDAGPGGTDAGPEETDAGSGMNVIPGCGTDMDDDWGFGVTAGTPGEASPVGIVSAGPGYLDATTDATTGDVFYVFCTSATFTGTFDVNIFENTPMSIEYVHVHDGAGMVFGAEIAPVTSTRTGGSWALLPDHLYVLEIHGSMGTFF